MQETRSSLIKNYCLPIMTSQCSGCLSLEKSFIRRMARAESYLIVLKSHVVLLQTAHYWANAGVLLGARMHRERVAFEKIKVSG